MTTQEFAGKRALVTGGTKGMGEAIVRRLREAGASVFTTARSAPNNLEQPDFFIAADIGTAEGATKVAEMTLRRLGGIDILVNNVGGSSAPAGGFAALTDSHWQAASPPICSPPCGSTGRSCQSCCNRSQA